MLKCTSNTWEKTNSNGFCFSRTLSFFTSFLLSWTNQTFQTCQSIRAIFISHHPPQCFLFWENVRWYIVIITCVLLRSLHKDTTQRSMENYPGWSTETLELVNLGHAFLNAEQYKYIQMIQILINITKCTYIYIYRYKHKYIIYIYQILQSDLLRTHDLFEGWNRDLHLGPLQMITCESSLAKITKKKDPT